MTGHNVSLYPWGPPDVCGPGLILPILDERLWNLKFRAILYFLLLLYCFIGVAIVTDVFMSAIEMITSKTRKVYLSSVAKAKKQNGSYNAVEDGPQPETNLKEDEPEVIEVRVWNDTVANLTLMALGTSAPEILLSVIEIAGHHFESGKLGPGTIVGSAAFNLLIITSVCMLSLPAGQTRKIERFKVFVVTMLFSFFAYIWLLLILRFISPNVVELWEAIITFLLFPILTIFAFSADKGWCGLGVLRAGRNKRQLELGPIKDERVGSKAQECASEFFKEGKLDKDNLVKFVKEVKKYPGLTDEDAAMLAAAKMVNSQHHTAMWYRIGAVRTISGGRRMEPVLNNRLKQVYEVINNHPEAPTLGEVPQLPDLDTHAVVEFHAATVAVRENIGKFNITIWRHGNLEPQVRVRVESIDGTARRGEDYVAIREILTFEPGEKEKQVTVEIVNDNKWEPNEEFFLRMTLINVRKQPIKLGRISVMEVTIIDDDQPGIISFAKRGFVVKESAGVVQIPVRRTHGADGDITVKYRTIDKSAISGRDYTGGEGELSFKHCEVERILEIPIIDDMDPEKDECFEVELLNPTGGARIGNINRVAITITNDDDFNTVMDRLMALTNTNLDAVRIHTETWSEQIKTAMTVKGGDVANATAIDYLMHFLSFLWKVIFSLIPPPGIFGGWLCFFVSLIGIGLVTAIIGDLATIFGCLVGLDDTITALTLVAMGTSLPDTFASKTAANSCKNADDCIGNITGSNSVNVFLGLGLPWLLAASYHFSQLLIGAEQNRDPKAITIVALFTSLPDLLASRLVTLYERHADGALIHITGSIAVNVLMGVGMPWLVAAGYHSYKGSQFMVPAGALGFSVLMYSIAALLAVTLLLVRRRLPAFGSAEIGGPQIGRIASTVFLVTLWILYILFSCLQIYKVIDINF